MEGTEIKESIFVKALLTTMIEHGIKIKKQGNVTEFDKIVISLGDIRVFVKKYIEGVLEKIGKSTGVNVEEIKTLISEALKGKSEEYKEEVLKELSKEGIEVITSLLSLDPKKRPSCEELLEKDYFKNATMRMSKSH